MAKWPARQLRARRGGRTRRRRTRRAGTFSLSGLPREYIRLSMTDSRLSWFPGRRSARLFVCACAIVMLACAARPISAAETGDRLPATAPLRDAPLMRDFMGLNVHTVQFKPDLYAPVCRLLRDYHPMGWDLINDDPARRTTFPMAANGVDWGTLYGSWVKAGFDVDA